ncbi:UDP-N-acetylmuramoyl-L-alanyl-D-glutamate--2,6-diaminopimelate ligase [Alysiella filiformis]|uniref:UDP-N-acetylmuramoyl-L-alanyl-D-glutamate--2,6-diaminopimelate ligase n=1 Tax=Alysiella filiformis DSM 16848 TaxID=1120981 RepID=A0A286E317_9NEIS|nr:UDP-N-acetylmuramoyl-L-alanyl-D-glutamate--2,6-diaminopimelate ligase [Alysiella filiformis]QMT31148.1 UDP-N-acetylmuramoyl-L-alanyl-D-glutamate--2,6-diaminopimelate ligase [Alysiella filiformis]UBQ55860.1 UDP-N-acetylmuramoyl-L-alanyl-D-glutamate--2,6-diaminopimelate ligase [Alysiella filiformis DSM 16848]SOD65287.1 UDP-N-acetylmuramoylalanyl-D-glutamate--2,6-diaminopimelate ligase [Alysiella filiformis DSM 16848]
MYSQIAAPNSLKLPELKHHVSQSEKLTSDSRQIQQGDVFVACQGEYADGRNYIQAAINNGAKFVYWDADGDFVWQNQWAIPNQPIADLRQCAGILAAQAYGNLSGSLNIVGVTGTNGKTSITQWLAQAIDILEQNNPLSQWERAGERVNQKSCAIIGTVGNGFFGELQETSHTTPDPVSVQTLLRQFKHLGAKHIAMEVSSHGLHQFRVNGVPFRTAVFTNLTRDHLDYHSDMDDYGATKARLFHWQGLENAIINQDDEFGAKLIAELREKYPHLKTISYGFDENADIHISGFVADTRGMRLTLKTIWGDGEVETRLLGRFNAQNFAACVGVLCANGWDLQAALNALSQIRPATGRMDCIINENKPLIVVDYAHTPDALEKALTTLREIQQPESRLWCVFGCGGNRDRGKRPLMGAVASQFSDCPVVTSDNPRMEDPQAILDDILPAVPNAVLVQVDRKLAIEQAIAQANPQDIVLIAGKGHETYQDIQGVKTHFSDFEVAEEALSKRV